MRSCFLATGSPFGRPSETTPAQRESRPEAGFMTFAPSRGGSASSQRRLIASGKLKAYRVGRQLRVDKGEMVRRNLTNTRGKS
jgi:hypothetical protein